MVTQTVKNDQGAGDGEYGLADKSLSANLLCNDRGSSRKTAAKISAVIGGEVTINADCPERPALLPKL
jgi:hypothetical protein